MATHTLLTAAVDLNLAASYDTATAPSGWTNGDTLVIPDGTDATTNNNAISAAGIVLNRVEVGPNSRRQIGEAGSPFTVAVSNGTGPKFMYGGQGPLFYSPGSGAACTQFLAVTTNNPLIVLGTGTVTLLVMQEGSQVEVGGACVLTNYVKSGGPLTIRYNATSITTGEDQGGRTRCFRTLATLNISRARERGLIRTIEQIHDPRNIDFELMEVAGVSVKIDTKLTLRGAAVYNHQSTGDIDALDLGSGCAITPKGAKTNVTVGAAAADVVLQHGSSVVRRYGGVGFEFPATITEYGDINTLIL